MSWFSPDVLGGDTPMDVLSHIGAELGEGELYPLDLSERSRARIRAKLEASGEALLESVLAPGFAHTMAEPGVSLPVLAAVHLASGAAMPDRLRAMAADAARRDPVSAPDLRWSSGRVGWPERRAYMGQLAALIEAHRPGDAVLDLGHVGLMERMARAAGVDGPGTLPEPPAALPGPGM